LPHGHFLNSAAKITVIEPSQNTWNSNNPMTLDRMTHDGDYMIELFIDPD